MIRQLRRCESLIPKVHGFVTLIDVAMQVRRSRQKTRACREKSKREPVWCLISSSFLPREGGVEHYLYSVSRQLKDGLIVLTPKSDGWQRFDWKQDFTIHREGWSSVDSFFRLRRFLLVSLRKRVTGMSRGGIGGIRSTWNILFQCAFSLHLPELRRALALLNEVLQIMEEKRIKLVHCGYGLLVGSLGLVLKELFGIPFVMYAYGMELLQWRKSALRHRLAGLVFANADAIVAVSGYTRRAVCTYGLDESKIHMIRPGVDPTRFSYPVDTTSVVSRYGLGEKRVLLTVSHLVDRKGHDMVIRALPDVLREIPNLLYLIVGRGPSEPTLRHLVNSFGLNNHVVFTGYLPDSDIPRVYNACDIFVMPSRETIDDVEGFGLAFLEANACCKPVVGGRGGGVEDAVVNNVTGLVVSPTDPRDIAAAVLRLLKDRRLAQTFGAYGRRRVLREFTWERVADSVGKLNARLSDV